MKIKTVTVIGAAGTMGRNVAAIFASFGDAKVFMVGRDVQKIRAVIPKSIASVRADSIEKKLIPADMAYLEAFVKESDLIFESVSENLDLKRDIARRVGASMRSDAISCTGSSGLSINALASCYPEELRPRFFGVHMFNPPYRMPLCELCSSDYSDSALKEELRQYLSSVLYRKVVEVRDSPAFLANRIGFQFINNSLRFAAKYSDNGGIDYIDSILGSFTGRAMPPLVTADFVGLDTHRAIVDNIYQNTDGLFHDSFVLPEFVSRLIRRGCVGKKSSAGLYKTVRYDDGRKKIFVYDIAFDEYRESIRYVFPFAEAMKDAIRMGDYRAAMKHLVKNHSSEAEICLGFLLDYIVYSLYTAQTVGFRIADADDVMALGFNWCPPIALLSALKDVADIDVLICRRLGEELYRKLNMDSLMQSANQSEYDYRKYLKSGR